MGASYDYLLSMQLASLTLEKVGGQGGLRACVSGCIHSSCAGSTCIRG